MESVFEWKVSYLGPVLTIGLATIGFITYWFIAQSESIKNQFLKKYGEDLNKIYFILFQKYTGFVFLGLLPTIIALIFLQFNLTDFGLNANNLLTTFYWTSGLGLLLVFINFMAARKPDNYKIYPQIRINNWTSKLIIMNSISWICYLFAYELLFRGILLTACIPAMGIWPAIAVNITIYSCTHIPKGINEALATIPFGIVLCVLTILTGNLWTAIFTHVILALSNDYFAVYYNPEMKFSK